MIFERLDTLEAKVRETLGELGQLRSAREALEAKLRAAEAEIESRDKELAALRAEQQEARARVDSILGAIEEAVADGVKIVTTPRRGGENGQSRPARGGTD